jgi:spore coat protein A, manganese oxidase
MTTRRTFLRAGVAAGAGAYLTSKLRLWSRLSAQVPGGTLSPASIPKFASSLFIPPAMPRAAVDATTDYYTIGVRQFTQQILPAPLARTTVWGYGSLTDPATFHYPSPSFEARAARMARVKWINQLVDNKGTCLQHLLPVDQTLHWANPPGGMTGRDMRGSDSNVYRGPVPMVPHVHGHHSGEESDGYPEAWFLPDAKVPKGFAKVGSWYEYFRQISKSVWNVDWDPGSATFTYTNQQPAATLWYHDHAMGITRLNSYAGPVGFYLLRGGSSDLATGLPRPAPAEGDGPGVHYYEVPLVIQDRSFDEDGSLFYPDNRAFFEELRESALQIPYIPRKACNGPSDVSPIWNPEVFGSTILVNGRTWPYLTVEQRRYRFRLLNACNSRFLILKMSRGGLPFWQIGGDGGFLAAPVSLTQVILAPGERADVIVDFTNVPRGTEVVLLNLAPDEPFGGGVPGVGFDSADPGSTGLVMQFRIVAAASRDTSMPPASLTLPALSPLPPPARTRHVSINEAESDTVTVDKHTGHGHRKHQPPKLKLLCDDANAVPFGPTHAMLGLLTGDGKGEPLPWTHDITENPSPGATEMWAIHNFTEDAHPIHIHLVQFEIVERENSLVGARGPEAWERGRKDTVIAYPGEITRLKLTFEREGRFVWHCHVLEHEDNEMMRPFVVGEIKGPASRHTHTP